MRGGKSNQEIAQILYIAPGTVRVHVHAILQKLEVRDRTQAAVLAPTERIGSRRTFRQSILSLAVYNDCQTSLAIKYEFYELGNPIKKIT